VVRIEDALRLAESRNLDLVEVAPNANPPVCKLLDYGRFKYEQTKREREARKGQKQLVLKEIWFRPNVNQHDRLFKTKRIRQFLEEGDKVKATVRFRGREIAHPELARNLLNQVAEDLKAHAAVEKPPVLEARSMSMIVAPGKALLKPPATPTAVTGRPPEAGAAAAPVGAPAVQALAVQREDVKVPTPA